MTQDFFSSNKKIYDPLHGFIRFDGIEKKLIDSLPFQRLHHIHQLGIAYLVYPGATHSRFEHSLGVMELATQIYHRLCKTTRPDVFDYIPRKNSSEFIYWEKILRLAALCHDLGHLPFSHVAEDKMSHENWTLKILQSSFLKEVFKDLYKHPIFQKEFSQRNVVEDITKIAIGEDKLQSSEKYVFSSWEKILSQIITGNFFGADRIDYLLRDSQCTGVVYGLFDYIQLIEMLRILPSMKKEGQWELGIDENGLESCEALLLARHFMYKRVYQYPSIRAFSFHLRRFMQTYFQLNSFKTVDQFLLFSDAEVTSSLSLAARDKKMIGHKDAKKIIERKNHFKAIPITTDVSVSHLKGFRKKQGIEEENMQWEINDLSNKARDLSFPVAKRSWEIEKAKDSSSLLSNIPSTFCHWVYIAPEYEILFLQFLQKR